MKEDKNETPLEIDDKVEVWLRNYIKSVFPLDSDDPDYLLFKQACERYLAFPP